MPGKISELILSEIEKELSESPSVFFGSFSGFKVADFEELRKSLDPISRRCLVVKNRLAKLAFKHMGKDSVGPMLSGMSCLMMTKDDVQLFSKRLVGFVKGHEENFKLRGAVIDGKVVEASYIKALAALPSKEEMRARVVCTVKAPITHFVLNLKGLLQSLVIVLNAARQKAG